MSSGREGRTDRIGGGKKAIHQNGCGREKQDWEVFMRHIRFGVGSLDDMNE